MTVADIAPARSYVERVVGRELRPAEQVIDVLKLDGALNRAKDELDAAIHTEMLRAARVWLRGFSNRPRLRFTDAMRQPLQALHDLGIEEARAELDRAGYPVRALAAPDPDPLVGGLDEVFATVEEGLPGIGVRIQDELLEADLSAASSAAIARALANIPGGRDLASRVVSMALTSGMAQTFEEHADLVPCWEYTAVLDAGTCDRCQPLDGTEYHSLEALFRVLPNFGPNPSCRGGGRCRCRAVPCANEGDAPPAADTPEAEPPALAPSDVVEVRGGTRGALVARRQTIESTLGNLDRLIQLPDRANIPGGRLPVTMRTTRTARGHFKYGSNGVPVEINVSSDAHPAVTFAHEYGHFLDFTYIGRVGVPATRNVAAVEGELGEALRALDDAWKASNAYGTLNAHSGDSLARYMRSRSELWARSFAQWASRRAGAGPLRDQMARDLAEEARRVRELGDVPGWRFYPETWQGDDFDAIDEAITRVLRAAGLLRE